MLVEVPDWVWGGEISSTRICGIGVAGAAYDRNSPYPGIFATERSVHNLAGALQTNIKEAIINREKARSNTKTTTSVLSVTHARYMHIDDEVIKRVSDNATTDFWLDEEGAGPFASKGFTYAQSCLKTREVAGILEVDAEILATIPPPTRVHPKEAPGWITKIGRQGDQLCAVGYSLPTFYTEKMFVGVVEDVRQQLSTVLQTLVSSYMRDHIQEKSGRTTRQLIQLMLAATTEAVSKGALVTHYWYDRDGIGPFGTKRTTYGWGCVYPIDVLRSTAEAVEEKAAPLTQKTIHEVREHAEKAFEALDAEIERRSTPSRLTSQTADLNAREDVAPEDEPTPPPPSSASEDDR